MAFEILTYPKASLKNIGISDRLHMTKGWLADCQKNHALCRPFRVHKPPTRLIQIKGSAIKLVRTADLDTTPPYATLSYCWGRDPFTMLTAETKDTFFRDIPVQILPQTFQDAITITDHLGLSYLWIDALCIIQQDAHDWSLEAGRMWSVYGGSRINIAASSAKDAQGGCLYQTRQSGFRTRVKAQDHCLIRSFYPIDLFEEDVDRSNLADRAWAFQERILAPRTVHWGERGVIWECRTRVMLEHAGIPDPHYRGMYPYQLVREEWKSWDWNVITQRYSAAKLTHASDRLPALSGIARRQNELVPDKYLAGMWRHELVKQLLWCTKSRNKRPQRTMPTWSWASVDSQIRTGEVFWHLDQRYWRIYVLGAWTTLSTSDPFGPVTGGELRIGCAGLLRGTRVAHNTVEIELPSDSFGPGIRNIFSFYEDCMDDQIADSKVFLLPVAEVYDPQVFEECGLVLRPSSQGKGHFSRIGYFELRRNMKVGNWDLTRETVRDIGPGIARTECIEVMPNPDSPKTPFVIVIH